jgi:hypothetical protein
MGEIGDQQCHGWLRGKNRYKADLFMPTLQTFLMPTFQPCIVGFDFFEGAILAFGVLDSPLLGGAAAEYRQPD